MGALFDFSELEANQNGHHAESAANHKAKHHYALGKNKALLSDLLPAIEKEHTYHVPSFGSFSTYIAIEHVLSIIGPSSLTLTTWAISEAAIRSLIDLMDRGMITQLHCLFDERVKTYAPNAWQLAQHRLANIWLGKCHAKLTVLQNDHFDVTIVASANLSLNKRIEAFVFIENKSVAQFYTEWISKIMQGANPFSN